jgi:RNA-directed DNA polymerase
VTLEAKRIAVEWLKGMGLELKDSKTRVTHTLEEYEGNVGFDFLNFNVRQFHVGKSHWRTSGGSRILLDFITIIRPSKKAIKRQYQKVAQIINHHNSAPQEGLIRHLNPVIKGWCNYYSTVCSKKTFSKLEHLTCRKLLRWAKRRHPHASRWKTNAKYWHPDGRYKWSFATREGLRLWRYDKTPIRRHIKVEGSRSPYDGDWVYWATRMGHYPMIAGRKAILLRNQKGKCPWCGLFFKQEDDVEIDHIIPHAQGGRDTYANLQLLHGYCHQQKSALDKGCAVEEPCELESLMHGSELAVG